MRAGDTTKSEASTRARPRSERDTARVGGDEVVRVLVVDDQQPFRSAAAAVLAHTAGFVMAGEAETGEDAVQSAVRLQPELVLMDVRLPGISGVEAARRITDLVPSVVVLLCSTYPLQDLPSDVAAAKVAGYLHKAELRPELLHRLWAQARIS